MSNAKLPKAEAIIAQSCVLTAPEGGMPYCVLALMDASGYPTVSTITATKAEGLTEIVFCTGLQSNKAKRIAGSSRASVCFNADDYNITLVGDMEVSVDPALKKAYWYDALKQHFTGPEDPSFCILRFRTKRYSLLIDWEESEGTL